MRFYRKKFGEQSPDTDTLLQIPGGSRVVQTKRDRRRIMPVELTRTRARGICSLIIFVARLVVDGRDGVELRTLGYDDIIVSHGPGGRDGGGSIPRDLPHSGVRMRSTRLIEIAFNSCINQNAAYIAGVRTSHS